MEEELAKLIYDSKKTDPNFINNAFELMLSFYNIGDIKLKYIENKKILGEFSDINNTIYLSFMACNTAYNIISKIFLTGNYGYQLYLLSTMLHELEHVKQRRQLIYNNDIEGIIICNEINVCDIGKIKYNFLTFIKDIRKLCLIKKLYMYRPTERLAEIYSNEKTANISKILKDSISEKLYKHIALCSYSFGYLEKFNKNISPTNYFFKKFGIDINEQIKNYIGNLSAFNKFKYGLNVTEDDWFYLNQKLHQNELNLRKK